MPDEPLNPELDADAPSPKGLVVTADKPYRMLVVSDLAGSESGSLSGPLADAAVDVKPDSFDELMKQSAPTVKYTTTDPVLSGNVMVEVNVAFESLHDFEPENLAERIPAANSLMAIRRKIVERMTGKINDDQLADAVASAAGTDSALEWIAESVKWSPAQAAASEDVVDDVLSQIDLGGESQEQAEADAPPKTPIGSLVSAAAGAGASMPSEQTAALRRTLAEIDRRVGAWINTVLHAPQVQSLEAAWRSLAFLIPRIDFRKGIHLAVLHAPAGELSNRFVEQVIDPVFDEGADAPHAVIVDHAFGNSATDIETLDEFAQHGASLPAIVIAGVGPDFFGVKHAWQIPTLPAIINIFDQWQFAKWKTLREQPHARALGVVFGRCLLREPHDVNGEGASLDFTYHEPRLGEKDFLWANGSIVVACTIAHSVAERGWPTAMSGYAHGRVEGFKTAEGGKKGDKKYGPTDTDTPQAKIEEMAAVGINAAVAPRDLDDALFWNGLTAARPQRMDPESLLEVSLPYQLFAGRLADLLFDLKPHLAGKSAEAVVPFVHQHVADWLSLGPDTPPEQLAVRTRPAEDDPNVTEMAVTVTPPQQILPGAIPVVLGYRLT